MKQCSLTQLQTPNRLKNTLGLQEKPPRKYLKWAGSEARQLQLNCTTLVPITDSELA